MTAFQKPRALKAALKMALYGSAGAGKTFTSLRIAEGLAQHTGKRIAFVDTENGTAFYGQHVPQRRVHPEAFDFDALYSRSITEVLTALRHLDPNTHSVVVIDSISHLWDACKNAYTGRMTRAGTVPLNAWPATKTPVQGIAPRAPGIAFSRLDLRPHGQRLRRGRGVGRTEERGVQNEG
jgi:KaiC/GvpD/RAD55 family RecA-like ATPase